MVEEMGHIARIFVTGFSILWFCLAYMAFSRFIMLRASWTVDDDAVTTLKSWSGSDLDAGIMILSINCVLLIAARCLYPYIPPSRYDVPAPVDVDNGWRDKYEVHVITNAIQTFVVAFYFGIGASFINADEIRVWRIIGQLIFWPQAVVSLLSWFAPDPNSSFCFGAQVNVRDDYVNRNNLLMRMDIYVDFWTWFGTTAITGFFDFHSNPETVCFKLISFSIFSVLSLWDIFILKGLKVVLQAVSIIEVDARELNVQPGYIQLP